MTTPTGGARKRGLDEFSESPTELARFVNQVLADEMWAVAVRLQAEARERGERLTHAEAVEKVEAEVEARGPAEVFPQFWTAYNRRIAVEKAEEARWEAIWELRAQRKRERRRQRKLERQK